MPFATIVAWLGDGVTNGVEAVYDRHREVRVEVCDDGGFEVGAKVASPFVVVMEGCGWFVGGQGETVWVEVFDEVTSDECSLWVEIAFVQDVSGAIEVVDDAGLVDGGADVVVGELIEPSSCFLAGEGECFYWVGR